MKKHTEEFKQEGEEAQPIRGIGEDRTRIALSSGLSRRRIAADLGVGLSTLGKWVSVYRPTDLVSALAKQIWPRRTNGVALRTAF